MHLDPDRLVLVALAEDDPTPAELSHLATCAHCRAEVDSYAAVARIGRETRPVRDLDPPPAHVWDRIATATGVNNVAGTSTRAAARTGAGSGRRWRRTALAAAAVVIVVVALILGGLGLRGTSPGAVDPAVVTARADLVAFGRTPPGAHGAASVVTRDGAAQLHVQVADLPAEPGYYEVWLIDPDTTRMFSIGVLGGQSDVYLPLPSSVDLRSYRLVDVSAELYDGNAAHSGNSLLRGTLTT